MHLVLGALALISLSYMLKSSTLKSKLPRPNGLNKQALIRLASIIDTMLTDSQHLTSPEFRLTLQTNTLLSVCHGLFVYSLACSAVLKWLVSVHASARLACHSRT